MGACLLSGLLSQVLFHATNNDQAPKGNVECHSEICWTESISTGTSCVPGVLRSQVDFFATNVLDYHQDQVPNSDDAFPWQRVWSVVQRLVERGLSAMVGDKIRTEAVAAAAAYREQRKVENFQGIFGENVAGAPQESDMCNMKCSLEPTG